MTTHHCINCGVLLELRVIEGRELEACPNDDFVLWRDPKVATAVVVEAGGGVVLGRRAIEPGLGLWCLPGGYVNDDEGPLDAAVRECREEIGADVDVIRLIGVYHIPKRSGSSIVGIAYLARLAEYARLDPGGEMAELDTCRTDELPQLAFSSHRQILEDYVRSRELQAEGGPPNAAAAAPRAARPSRAPGRSQRTRTR